jgi:hypothetical protein
MPPPGFAEDYPDGAGKLALGIPWSKAGTAAAGRTISKDTPMFIHSAKPSLPGNAERQKNCE